MEKFNNFFEKIPNSLINFLGVASGIITILTPIVGFLAMFNTIKDNKNGYAVYWIFAIILIVFVSMIILLMRYVIKYKKLLLKTRKVTTNNYFKLTRNFRNSYFDILSLKKQKKLTVELLVREINSFLGKALNDICEIFSEFTNQEVSACIKYIDGFEDSIDRETATITTLMRSDNSDSKRSEWDNINSGSIYVKDNTDFYDILSPHSRSRKSYFYQRNLVEYSEYLKKKGDSYNNTTKNWDKYYRATIVVPISVANKRLYYKNDNACYNVLGFLCIDSLSTDAFLEREEKYNINIAQAFAAEIYVILNQYKYYLKKLTEGEKND